MNEESKSNDPEETVVEQGDAAEASAREESAEQTQDDLQLLLEDARSKADEHWDQLLRVNAELENTRRRAERDIENAHKYGLEKFAQELLPVKDSMELGLDAASGDDENVAKLREGTELTLKMLSDVMEKFGIKEVNPAGEPFNPELHQAMTMQESAEHEPNTVMMVMQKGYLLNERLVRPAMVVVSKTPAES